MSQRQDRIARTVAVEREYLAAYVAADLLQERLGADPAFLASHELRSRDARNLRAHLEGTYVIRLCAEFEAGLRDAWQNAFGRPTHHTAAAARNSKERVRGQARLRDQKRVCPPFPVGIRSW